MIYGWFKTIKNILYNNWQYGVLLELKWIQCDSK